MYCESTWLSNERSDDGDDCDDDTGDCCDDDNDDK